MTQVSGAVAVVTGGNRGIGKAFVAELLNRGAVKIYATARSSFVPDDDRVVPVVADVTSDSSVAELADRARDATIIVNNAGVLGANSLLTADLARSISAFETNVYGPLRVAQHFAPVLEANGGGAFVNMLSVMSWACGAGAYGASKAAIWSLTNSLRDELRPRDIQVVGVHVGYVDTDMAAAVDAPKNSPHAVAVAALDGLEAGDAEVLVDDVSRYVKGILSGPVEGLTLTR